MLAEEFNNVADKPIIQEMKEKLYEKFASEKHAGPKDVIDFLDLVDEDEIEMTMRDAYEQINALLNRI